MQSRILAATLFVLLSAGANAATLYVEKWGRTTAGCGSRNDPCSTINAAIAQPGFGTNARIRVGPGIYPESVFFTMDGVRLESMAGARVTMLRTPLAGDMVIHAQGDRVQIGRRGKGFTVTGATGNLSAGIRVEGYKPRVEGNIVYGNYYGIRAIGARAQVRYNEIYSNISYGLDCRHCDRGIIEFNEAINNSTGIGVSGIATRFQVRRNVSRDNLASGIEVAGSSTNQYTVKDNVVQYNGGGIGVNNADGAKFQGNLMGLNTHRGMRLDQSTFDKPATVRNNIAMGGPTETSHGFQLDTVGNLRFQGNSAVQNGGSGLSIGAFSTLNSLKGNNFYANGAWSPNFDCGISNASIVEPTVVQAFLGSPAGAAPGPDAQANDNDGHDTICGPQGYVLPGNAYIAKPRPYRANAAARL